MQFQGKWGSKYEYQRVLGQNAILGENQGQNMNIGEFWVKMQFWGKTRSKYEYWKFLGLNVNMGKLSMRKGLKCKPEKMD